MSNETNIDPIAFTEALYGEVPEIMQHLWSTLPFGYELKLSNGRTGKLKRFAEPRERDGRWELGFDVTFDDGASPDHLEFFLKHTGGGGMVMAPNVMRYIRSIDWLASIRGVSGHGMTSGWVRSLVLAPTHFSASKR